MRISILGLLALAACTNGGNCDSDCNTTVGTDTDSGDTCDSCGDDTGNPAETSYVTVQVFVPTEADIVSCHAQLDGPQAYAFDTTDGNGDPIVMPVVVGDYSVEVGDPANLTSYGASVHTASDGSLSIAPDDAQANVGVATESAPQVVTVDNIPYFQGVYSCGIVVFDYDPDTADHKSGTGRDLGAYTYSVEVDANGKIDSPDGSTFGVLPLNSYFVVTGENKLKAVFYQDDPEEMSIGASEITTTSFAAVVNDPKFGFVYDLDCDK